MAATPFADNGEQALHFPFSIMYCSTVAFLPPTCMYEPIGPRTAECDATVDFCGGHKIWILALRSKNHGTNLYISDFFLVTPVSTGP